MKDRDSLEEKRELLSSMRETLRREREETARLAKDAAKAATHEENRAEGDKDMRATEASYIARGQAERVHTIDHALRLLAALEPKQFLKGERIAVSALVTLECDGLSTRYFLVPAGGGMTLSRADEKVLTLATTSPLGRTLLGLEEGEEAEVGVGARARTHLIVRVI